MKKTELSEYFRKMGRKGGVARALKLTAEQRQEIARKAGSQKGKAKLLPKVAKEQK